MTIRSVTLPLSLMALLLVGFISTEAQGFEDKASAPATKYQAVDQLLGDYIQRARIPGAVALVLQRGEPIYSAAVGMQDCEAGVPMTQDTIFRIASMTKPVTSAAVLMLVEDGKIALDDPLSKFIPEFANPQVLGTNENGETTLVPAVREITIHDLLTQTSGITYGFFGQPVICEMYRKAGVSDGLVETAGTLADNVRRLAKMPLMNQPGAAWQYGLSTDVLGRVIEVASGLPLNEFFQQRLFAPLQMHDTMFHLPPRLAPRLAACYHPRLDGAIARIAPGPQTFGPVCYSVTFPLHGTYLSGGGGLVSTAKDYSRFLQMLLNKGELDGVRFLKPETVAAMTENQIGDLSCGFPVFGRKFGLGVGIRTADENRYGTGIGTYSWAGIFCTYFWVDPEAEVIGIVLTQVIPNDHLVPLWLSFEQAIYDGQKEDDTASR